MNLMIGNQQWKDTICSKVQKQQKRVAWYVKNAHICPEIELNGCGATISSNMAKMWKIHKGNIICYVSYCLPKQREDVKKMLFQSKLQIFQSIMK